MHKVIDILPIVAVNWKYAKKLLLVGKNQAELPEEPIINVYGQAVTIEQKTSLPTANDFKGEFKNLFCIVTIDDVQCVKDLDEFMANVAGLYFDSCVLFIDSGNGTGKPTKSRTAYHRNDPILNYMQSVNTHFYKYDVTLHRDYGCITIAKGRKFYELDDLED